MQHITKENLHGYERRYRANIINCISGCKPAILCGTKSAAGLSNLALFSNVFHLGADPALLGYVQRPLGESGHTFANIEATGSYTFNLVTPHIMQQAHQASARYAEEISEFAACALDEEYTDGVHAPYVAEAHIKIALQLEDVLHVKQNDTRILIGSVQHIMLPKDVLQADGNLLFGTQHAIAAVGLEQYYSIQFLQHMPYAKAKGYT